MNTALRLSLFSICSLFALVGCKARNSSQVKGIGAFNARSGAWKGGGRNSFYGTPRSICTYTNVLGKSSPAVKELEDDDWLNYNKVLGSQNGPCALGHVDGDGSVCLIPQSPAGSNNSFQGYIRLVENLSQLASVLDIDVAGKLSASGLSSSVLSDFTLSPTARYFNERQDNDRNLYVVVNVTFDAGSENFLKPAIKPTIMKPIADAVSELGKASTPQEIESARGEVDQAIGDFLDKCGDEFSNTINHGGEFTGIMRVGVSSTTSKEQALASLQAAIGFGPKLFGATAGLDASVEQLKGALKSVQNVDIWYAQSGGNPDGFRVVGVLDGIQGYQKLVESAENYIRLFNNPAAAAVSSTTHFEGAPVTPLDPRPVGSRGRPVQQDSQYGKGQTASPDGTAAQGTQLNLTSPNSASEAQFSLDDPGTPMDPGATPMDPGATPMDPGATPMDPGSTAPTDPGATPTDPGSTPPTDPGATAGTPPTDPNANALIPAGPEAPHINAGIRDAHYLSYSAMDDLKQLLRKAKLKQTTPESPKNYYEELAARRDRLVQYLANYERIRSNYDQLEFWAHQLVQPLTKNQKDYIEKYRKVYTMWTAAMKMKPDRNCKNLGTGCSIPEEPAELRKFMKESPAIILTDFKLPVPIVSKPPPAPQPKPKAPLVMNVNWAFSTTVADTIFAGYTMLRWHLYQEGVNRCGTYTRFPRPAEFKELLANNFLTVDAKDYLPYSHIIGQSERTNPLYQIPCFWEEPVDSAGNPKSINPDSNVRPAWTNETQANGTNEFDAPANRQCFVVCLLRSARPDPQ